MKAFQDFYPDELAHCYGCGRLNESGLHIRTLWDGEESVTRFTPRPYHTATPGFVNGGVLASLIDCHGTGTAAAAAYRAEGRAMDTPPMRRYRDRVAARRLREAHAPRRRARRPRPREGDARAEGRRRGGDHRQRRGHRARRGRGGGAAGHDAAGRLRLRNS